MQFTSILVNQACGSDNCQCDAACTCSSGSCHAPVNRACGSSDCNCNSSCGCESNNCNCN
uniref:Metallothionein n=2 Tax=Hebeloma cylindrosporum TaxID=76867 RepID=B6C961_HEBCY|nr:metallothionein [Hebeloma cylindrosporum]ACJ65191.1 metallothionein I [Hebeloma cylindrosporum]